MINDMELDRQIAKMKQAGTLDEFTARQVAKLPCIKNGCSFGYSKRRLATFGGGTATIVVIILEGLKRLLGG